MNKDLHKTYRHIEYIAKKYNIEISFIDIINQKELIFNERKEKK